MASILATQMAQMPPQVGQPMPPGPQVPIGGAPQGARSIYVGDLNPDVTEQHLFEVFNAVGPVLSIRICRDTVTRSSLGYAYVNFQLPADAERALDTMNFELIRGRPCRLMWCQRDPSRRRDNKGNIFIKNLTPTIDNKMLYDTFSRFGDILSCKVEYTTTGKSRGFGYVHFKTEDSALKAISSVNGMMLQIEGVSSENQKPLFVGPFQSRSARGDGEAGRRFTNLYVRGFPASFTKDNLDALFSEFGTIKSSIVMMRHLEDGTEASRQFGFVDFENHESAVAAKDKLNEKDMEGAKLLVTRAQKKAERDQMLRRRHDEERLKRRQQTRPFNLYVKHLDRAISDAEFTDLFKAFGTITSARVMRTPTGECRGFGFVCFSSKDEATNALTNMNGKMVGRAPLYVCNAQTKEERRQDLEMRMRTMRPPYGMPYAPQPFPFYPPMRMMAPMARRPYVPYQRQAPSGPYQPRMHPRPPQQRMMGSGSGPRPYTAMGHAGPPHQHQAIDLNQLHHAAPDAARQMLGSALYRSLGVDIPEEKRRKITGMLLELDQTEILHLLEDNAALQEKVNEAIAGIDHMAQAN